jgi:hypothetical protein
MALVASVLAWTLLLLLLCGATAAVKDIKSVYDDLTDYGLPIGLLPDSVINYSLSADGKFTVELEEPCYAKFQEQVSCFFFFFLLFFFFFSLSLSLSTAHEFSLRFEPFMFCAFKGRLNW